MSNFFDQFDLVKEKEPNYFDRFDPKPIVPGTRYDIAGAAAQSPVSEFGEDIAKAYEWSQETPVFVQKIVSDAEKAYRDAPSGSVFDAIKQAGILATSLRAAQSGQNPAENAREAVEAASKTAKALEEPSAAAGLFMAEVASPFTSPAGIASLASGPTVRGVKTLAQLGKTSPEIAQTVAATSVGVNTLVALPAAEAAGAAWGEASVNPTIENVAKAAGYTALAATGAAGAATDIPSAVKKISPRERVVTDKEWSQVKDRVKVAQVAEEVASTPETVPTLPEPATPAPQAIRALPEPATPAPQTIRALPEPTPPTPEVEGFVRTAIPSGETIRIPEALTEVEVKTAREAKTTAQFNARVKRITETFLENGVKLNRKQAAEMARITDPREYSLTRQVLLDAVRPPEVGGTPTSPSKTKAPLKGFEELTPEMVGVRPEEPVAPKKSGVIAGGVPILEAPAKVEPGLGEPALPIAPRMLELERPIYDSGLLDGQGNRVWVDEVGSPVDRSVYADPRERLRIPEEKAAYEQQLKELIDFEKRGEAVGLINRLEPNEAITVVLPDSPTPVPARFVKAEAGGKATVDTPQGRVSVEATALAPIAESPAPVAAIAPVAPVVTKVKDPMVGGWDVNIGGRKYRIYRDPESRNWFLDAPVYDPKLKSVGGHNADLLTTTTKEDAIRNLVENEARWIQKIQAAKSQAKQGDKTKSTPRKPATRKIFTDRERGAVNFALLNHLAQTTAGAGGGFYAGYNMDSNAPLSDRLVNGIQGAMFGFVAGNPWLRRSILRGIYGAKIPIKTLGGKSFAKGGMDNFVIFVRSALDKVYDEAILQDPRAKSLKEPALKAADYLIDQRGKAMKFVTGNPQKQFFSSDFEAVNLALVGGGTFNNIRDPLLQRAAKELRSRIDDLSRYLISSGFVKPGSDLQQTIEQSIGQYLYRTYRVFTDPDFTPDPRKMEVAAKEYATQLVIDGDTRPLNDLIAEGWKQVRYQFEKGGGSVLSNRNVTSFATGNGIARTDGTLLRPRKQLTDAWRDMMGEIKDPLQAASLTVDRLADAVASIKTQEAMAEAGLRLELFSRTRTPTHSIPLSDARGKNIYGSLGELFTTPGAADGLRSLEAYRSSGWAYRSLATLTGAVKIGKTAFSPVTYAVNLAGSSMMTLAQGSGLRVVLNPGILKDAFQVVSDAPFPKIPERLKADIELLIERGILRQGTIVNDLVEAARTSYLSDIGTRVITWVPKGLTTPVKKGLRGVLTTYGNFEEWPKIVGFYAEVGRWSDALFNKAVDDLTPVERATVYERAVQITSENYPNYLKVPEAVKRLSTLSVLNPFVSFLYELHRTTYTTLRRGASEFEEAIRTGNPKIAAIAASRISWTVGMIAGAAFISEGLKARFGISNTQEDEIRNNLPKWDQNGMLLMMDVSPNEVAYANQSYLFPQAIIAQAFKSVYDAETPAEALLSFAKVTAGEMLGEDGGLVIGPILEAVRGETNLGRKIYPTDGGKYIDVSEVRGKNTREALTTGQNFVVGATYVLNKVAPGFVTESQRWYRAAKEEIGPDGQVYKVSDQVKRLFGARIHRVNLPHQYRLRADQLAFRFGVADKEFRRVRNRLDTTPEKLETAYQLSEQSRKIIFQDLVQYLRGGTILQQPQDQLIKNLRESGVSSDLVFSAVTGVYIPGKKEATISARERYNLEMRGKSEGEKLSLWANVQRNDPLLARAWREFAKDEALGRTEIDRMLLSFDERDGTRALKSAIYILGKPTQAEREATYQGLLTRGILSGASGRQLSAGNENSAKIWAQANELVKSDKGINVGALPVQTVPPGTQLAQPPQQYVEGRIYEDRTTKKKVRYIQGKFVPVEPQR